MRDASSDRVERKRMPPLEILPIASQAFGAADGSIAGILEGVLRPGVHDFVRFGEVWRRPVSPCSQPPENYWEASDRFLRSF